MLSSIAFLTLFFYLLGTFLQSSVFVCPSSQLKWWSLGFGLIAVCLHAVLLHVWIDIVPGQNLSLLNLFSLITWVIAVLTLVIATRKSIELLLLIIFPLNAISIILVCYFPSQVVIHSIAHPDTLFHIIISLFSFCVLCFAGLLAVLLAAQEYCIRHKKCSALMIKLPALESSEILLFQVISLGFILLSAVLLTSIYFFHTLIFLHTHFLIKTLLTFLSWLVFGLLLLTRFKTGLRGHAAIYTTFLGVLLLILAVGL